MNKYSSVQPGWKQRKALPHKIRKALILLCLLMLAYLAGVWHLAGIYGQEIAATRMDLAKVTEAVGAWEDSVARYEGVIEKCQG